MSSGVWRTDALMQIIDVLWSELPADVAIDLTDLHPEVVEACRTIHEILYHQGEHHEGGLGLVGDGGLE